MERLLDLLYVVQMMTGLALLGVGLVGQCRWQVALGGFGVVLALTLLP